ncbi:hypothetical protein [Leptospira licerasiae]|uniref:hypothetical protein n=1 Tax=Leptospira licerasiae TaxID=447106 RepID=UPI001083067B|nr:hypothetical protein [Leptospira licerasiae]TGM85585.1 hypothetical protein EHR05_18710 [Leptospira licerasiae]
MSENIRNSISLFESLKNYLRIDANKYFQHLSAIREYLLQDNKNLSSEIISGINPFELGSFKQDVFSLLNNPNHPPGNSKLISEQIDRILEILRKIITVTNSDNIVVFYSWQSDLPHKYNRNFIDKALKKVCKEISVSTGRTINLDKDTLGVSGSPDIINEILKKIEKCSVFVADVTPVASLGNKKLTNPNVMLELGYAWKAKSSENILMILNEAYASTKELPFDLGFKRQIRYSYGSENAEPLKVDQLASSLKSQIRSIIDKLISL